MRRFSRHRVFAVAALVATLVSPVLANETSTCEGVELENLAERLPEAKRFAVADGFLSPLVGLWPVDPAMAARLNPDGATIFSRDGHPLLVTLTRRGCVVGAYEADRAFLWRRLREALGPAI